MSLLGGARRLLYKAIETPSRAVRTRLVVFSWGPTRRMMDHFSWSLDPSWIRKCTGRRSMHVERRCEYFPVLALGQTERVNGAQTVLLSERYLTFSLHSVLIRAGSPSRQVPRSGTTSWGGELTHIHIMIGRCCPTHHRNDSMFVPPTAANPPMA